MSPRAITFDFDGTLADSWGDIATSLNLALLDVGLPAAERDSIKGWIGSGVHVLIGEALPPEQRTDARINEVLGIYRAHYNTHCLDDTKLFAGIPEVLSAVKGRPLALVSNKPEGFLRKMVRALDLHGVFSEVLGGDTLPERKPHPTVLRTVAARLGCAPDDMWMVGDSETDIRAGHNAGCPVIACSWGLRGVATLKPEAPEHLVHTPAELLRVLVGEGQEMV